MGPGRNVDKIVSAPATPAQAALAVFAAVIERWRARSLRPQLGIEARLRTAHNLRPRVMRHLAHHLRQGAGEGMEGETDLVPPARTDHGAKDHVCLEDFDIGPIDARAPPWVPDIVEQEDAAGRLPASAPHSAVAIPHQP